MKWKCCLVVVTLCLPFVFSKTLFLIGGGLSDDNSQLWTGFVDLAGGGSARVGVVTAASADPEDSAVYYDEMFKSYGAGEVYWIPVHEGNKGANSDPVVIENVLRMTGFFFGGGDQQRIINSFYNDNQESPVLAALRGRYEDGAVVGGTSAGASCVNSAPMITGGMSYDGLRYGSFPSSSHPDDLTYDPYGGLQFIENLIVDTHFSERGREGRLIRLLSDTESRSNGATRGVGVDEDTAFILYNVGESSERAEVLGENGVFLADIKDATADDSDKYWRITNVQTYYLTEGDSISMANLVVTYASWKSTMKGQEKYDYAATSQKIFDGNRSLQPGQLPEYPYVATSVFDSRNDDYTWGKTAENPQFRVDFTANAASKGYGGRNPRTNRFDMVYNNLKVDIEAD